jgi:hypothetical protein
MKAVKINAIVNLTNGLTVNSGSCLIIAEAYTDNKNQKDLTIPTQVATLLYQSKNAYNAGKTPISEIADFKTTMVGSLLVSDYETKNTEQMLLDFIIAQLTPIYGAANLEVINITPRAV